MAKPKDIHDRDPELEHIFNTVLELHERIAKIRPNLIVSLQFGNRLNRPSLSDDPDPPPPDPPFPPGGPSFNDFENAPTQPFTSSFAKAGDGFVNINGLDLASRVDVLPAIDLKQIKGVTNRSGE